MGLNRNTFNFLSNEISEEKGFKEVLKKLYKLNFTKRKFFSCLIVALLTAIPCYIISYAGFFTDIFFDLINISITIGVGILGFLIAGFSIYMSTIDKDFMYALLLQRYKETGISFYKYSLISYLEPFIFFMLIIVSSVILRTLYPLKILINSQNIFLILQTLVLTYIVYVNILSLYILKNFILNIYGIQCAIARNEVLSRFAKSNKQEYSIFIDKLESELENFINNTKK